MDFKSGIITATLWLIMDIACGFIASFEFQVLATKVLHSSQPAARRFKKIKSSCIEKPGSSPFSQCNLYMKLNLGAARGARQFARLS
jgi:hypothetical protein